LKANGVGVFLDDSDQQTPGWKFAEYELQGIPLRLEIGAKDIEKNQCVVARRDSGEKITLPLDSALPEQIKTLLNDIQHQLFQRALAYRTEKTKEVKTYDEFKAQIETGFAIAHWDGTAETEAKIKEETKATIRCIPTDEHFIQQYNLLEEGQCIYSGKPSKMKVVFAKAY
ncbi:MAG: His/Gly/Thr/Pro-type tRNA ligase C-terminal domain-containing protein, partial [Chloroherpetonaceae bacterium]